MEQPDRAALRVRDTGGTGTISASWLRLPVASGMAVSVLDRGSTSAAGETPEGVTWLTGEVTEGVLDRFVDACHAARDVFAGRSPSRVEA
ncbi:hypothetical protein GCM10009616_13760 [Microlunatus lacustris]